jgi:hypothetical protein
MHTVTLAQAAAREREWERERDKLEEEEEEEKEEEEEEKEEEKVVNEDAAEGSPCHVARCEEEPRGRLTQVRKQGMWQ